MTTVVVGTRALRNALQACVPLSVPSQKREMQQWHRVRIEVPASGPLMVSATNGTSSALASVPTWDDDTRSATILDLTPEQVHSLLKVFTPPAAKDDALPEESELQIDILDNAFNVLDVSGLPGIDGRHFGEPRIEVDEKFADIPNLMSRLHSAPEVEVPMVVTTAKGIAAFRPAANAFGEYQRITAHEGWLHAYGIAVGSRFRGLMYAPAPTDGERAAWDEANTEWRGILPDPLAPPRNTNPE